MLDIALSEFFQLLYGIWALLFSWMPPALGIACTIILGIQAIIIILKLVAFVLDCIPFL